MDAGCIIAGLKTGPKSNAKAQTMTRVRAIEISIFKDIKISIYY
jgi:hypothetical protein